MKRSSFHREFNKEIKKMFRTLTFIAILLSITAIKAIGHSNESHNYGLHHDHIGPLSGFMYKINNIKHANLDTDEHHQHWASEQDFKNSAAYDSSQTLEQNFANSDTRKAFYKEKFGDMHTLVEDPDYARPTPKISPNEDDLPQTLLSFPVEIDFGQEMSGFTESDITVRNGTISNFLNSSDGWTCTFDITTENDGLVVIIVPANAAETDVGVGNLESRALITVKTSTSTELDVSIRGIARPEPNIIDVYIRFTDLVDDFILSDITRTGVSGLTYNLTGGGNEYILRITVPLNHQGGNLQIIVPADVATNVNGVGNTASNTITVAIDIEPPTVESITLTGAGAELVFSFSENVADFVEDDITQSGAGSFNILRMSRSADSNGRANRFTAIIQVTRAGSVTVGVREGAVRDAARNTNVAFSNSTTITLALPTPDNREPTFNEDLITIRHVSWATPAGEPFGSPVSAYDPDGNTLTYSIHNKGSSSIDANKFEIDSSTGQLSTKVLMAETEMLQPIDPNTGNPDSSGESYEAPVTRYSFLVRASDGNGGSKDISVIIIVDDPDINSAPYFTNSISGRTTRRVAENTEPGTAIGQALNVIDPDINASSNTDANPETKSHDMLTYTLNGTDAASFDISRVGSTGQAVQLKTKASLNFETKSTYNRHYNDLIGGVL